MTIDVSAPLSWPVLLSVADMAAIYQYQPSTVQQYAARGKKTIPAPFLRHPYRWRRADVIRHLEPTPIRKSA